jgi:hypothetical protein
MDRRQAVELLVARHDHFEGCGRNPWGINPTTPSEPTPLPNPLLDVAVVNMIRFTCDAILLWGHPQRLVRMFVRTIRCLF